MKKFILPKDIILTEGTIHNLDNLFVEKYKQIGLSEKSFTEMTECSSILLDFGQEICGGIRMLICNFTNLPVKLRITFGESISEALSSIGEKNSTNDHSVRDYEIITTNLCDIETGQTGFRYVKITKLTEKPVIRFKNIYAVSNYSVNVNECKFISDDLLINNIFETAARTVDLCVQNGYVWDGIKRDRLVWIGDLYPEYISLSCLHKNLKEIKNSLIFVKEQTKLPSWMNNIPMYSMWWLIILYEYCFKQNDFIFLKKNKKYIFELTKQILDNINENGETTFKTNFLDWPTSKSEDEIKGVHALTIICLENVVKIYEYLEMDSSHIKHKLDLLKANKQKVLNKKQVAALLAYANKQYDADTLQFLTANNSAGFSTFMSYFILSVIFECGGKDESINLMKEYYGSMLKFGATSFFEDFDISWVENSFGIDSLPIEGKTDLHGDFGNYCYDGFRHSLCHGWSAGVIAFIVEKIIGIKVLEAGCKKILIKPYMGQLNYIKYRYPILKGYIDVELRKINGVTYCKYNEIDDVDIILEDAIKE